MCDFCDQMKKAVLSTRRSVGGRVEYRVRLEAALIKSGRLIGGESIGPFRLNVCPECGAKITRRLRQWRGENAPDKKKEPQTRKHGKAQHA